MAKARLAGAEYTEAGQKPERRKASLLRIHFWAPDQRSGGAGGGLNQKGGRRGSHIPGPHAQLHPPGCVGNPVRRQHCATVGSQVQTGDLGQAQPVLPFQFLSLGIGQGLDLSQMLLANLHTGQLYP